MDSMYDECSIPAVASSSEICTIGVGALMATLASVGKPTIFITMKDGKWNIKTEMMMKATDCTCRLNEEFEEKTSDGRKFKTIVTLEGDRKLIQIQKGGDGVPSTIIRELQDDLTMLIICKAKDKDGREVVATRVYKKA